MRFHATLFLMLLTCASGWAQIRVAIHREEESRTVVLNYCRMDYDGARLAKESWRRIKPLTTWKDNPDWQGFTVVSQYEVLSASGGARSGAVTVRYAVLGRFQLGMGYSAERGAEQVSFHLRDVDGDWKIEDLEPFINPHVSKSRAIAWLKSSLATEKDVVNKLAMEKALNDLGGK